MFNTSFYTDATEYPLTLYIKSAVINKILQRNPGMLLPVDADDSILAMFEFYPVRFEYESQKDREIEDSNKINVHAKVLKRVEKSAIGDYVAIFSFIADESLVMKELERKRAKRNELLREADLVLAQNITPNCRVKYEAYKQVLRDSLNIRINPEDIVFPEAPIIEYNTQNNTEDVYSSRYIEKIKNYVPDTEVEKHNYIKFLQAWKLHGYTNRKAMINNLSIMHDVLLPKQR